jgi:E3 ubiquitin-protein ligase RNF19A
MKKKETDSYSTASVNSRASEQKQRKPSRFSLQRLFYNGRPPSFSTPSRSTRSVRSQTEFEARSVSSLHSSHGEKEPTAQSSHSSEEAPVVLSRKGSRHAKGEGLECPLCLSLQPRDHFPMIMTCHHRSCRDCLRQYLKIEITESRINIACPECAERFHPNDIEAILEDSHLMQKYEEFMLRRVLVSDPDTRWCPAPDCGLVWCIN